MEAPPAKKAKLYTQENKKCVWLISYASGCQDITSDVLQSATVKCDEVYTITWRESKYTLFHLNKENRLRLSALKKVMGTLEETHGIKINSIFGYQGLACNAAGEASIQEHPGFKRMVQVLNQDPGELSSWLATGNIKTNRKGMLWKFIESTDPKQKTHGQLVSQILEWTPIVQEATTLRTEVETLKVALHIREKEILDAAAENARLHIKLKHTMDECTALKLSLGQNPEES
jgi:hypothetical protein